MFKSDTETVKDAPSGQINRVITDKISRNVQKHILRNGHIILNEVTSKINTSIGSANTYYCLRTVEI